MRKKKVHHVSLGVLVVFLFSLLFVMSWANPLVIDDGSVKVSPFLEISPFIVGFIIIVVVFILILLAVEKDKL